MDRHPGRRPARRALSTVRYVSTRGEAPPVSFDEALLAGLAPDGGLYTPEAWPQLSREEIAGFAGRPYAEVAAAVVGRLAGESFASDDLLRMCRAAYATFAHPAVTPLTQLDADLWLLELFHGPTLAFKDVAMQLLARLYDAVLGRTGRRLTLAVATSGDTALNAASRIDPRTGFGYAIAPLLAGWPGSIDGPASCAAMLDLTATLAALLLAADFGRDPKASRWLRRGWLLTGAALALLGLLQRWTHATDIYWSTERRLDYFFATFRNLTQAGEWFNALLPFALVEAWKTGAAARFRPWSSLTPALLLIVVAAILTAGSKLAPVLALLETILLAAWLRRGFLRFVARSRPASRALGLALIFAVFLVASLAADLSVSQSRWQQFWRGSEGGQASWSNRLLVARIIVPELPKAGWLGQGPGTFAATFPHFSRPAGVVLPGYWLAAHDDYLQTALEWGLLGSLLWAILFFGGLGRWLRPHPDGWGYRNSTRAALIVSLIGLGCTAAFDFPLQSAAIRLEVALLLGLAWSCPPTSQSRVRQKSTCARLVIAYPTEIRR